MFFKLNLKSIISTAYVIVKPYLSEKDMFFWFPNGNNWQLQIIVILLQITQCSTSK